MPTYDFVFVVTELSDTAGHAVAGPVPTIIGPYTNALRNHLSAYWAAASGGRVVVRWATDVPLQVPQDAKAWKALTEWERIEAVRGSAGIADGVAIILVANDTVSTRCVTYHGSSPYIRAVALSPAVVAHEMGHYFQWLATGGGGHADMARAFFRDEYGDPTCVMGGEDSKFTFHDPSVGLLAGHADSDRGGPLMSPAMVDLCGWLDVKARRVFPMNPVGLGTATIEAWRGAPAEGDDDGLPVVAVIDGFAIDGSRVYLSWRVDADFDRGFPAPQLCAQLSTPTGDSVLLGRCAPTPGSTIVPTVLPLQFTVLESGRDAVVVQVEANPWRRWNVLMGVECASAGQLAAVARHALADIFVIDAAGAVRYNHFDGQGWEFDPWPSLPGVVADPEGGIAAVARRRGLVEVFVVDRDGVLHRRQWRSSGWAPAWVEVDRGLDVRTRLASTRIDDDRALLARVDDDGIVLRCEIGDDGRLTNWFSAPEGRHIAGLAATPDDRFRGRIFGVDKENREYRLWALPDVASPNPLFWGRVGSLRFDPVHPIAATKIVEADDVVAVGIDPMEALLWDQRSWNPVEVPELPPPSGVHHPLRSRLASAGLAVVSRERDSFDLACIGSSGQVFITGWSPRPDYTTPARQYPQVHQVALRVANGQFVRIKNGGGDGVGADGAAIGDWETIRMIEMGKYTVNGGSTRRLVAFQAQHGQYVGAVGGGGSHVIAQAAAIGPWETFYVAEQGAPDRISIGCIDEVSLWTANGGGGSSLGADKVNVGPWETFTLVEVGP